MSIKICDIARQVADWSRSNFGDQEAKNPETTFLTGVLFSLGAYAPLLGIVEEFGEFHTALEEADASRASDDAIRDALGDMAIYLCDFMARAEIDPPDFMDSVNECLGNNTLPLAQAVGKLCRICLKGHQGIRGFDKNPYFRSQLKYACYQLWAALDCVSREVLEQVGIDELLKETWEGVVRKRDWKANSGSGQVGSAPGASS